MKKKLVSDSPAEIEPTDPLHRLRKHPRFREWQQLCMDAYKSWHHSIYGEFKTQADRFTAMQEAKRIRGQEQAIYAEMQIDSPIW